MPLWAVLTLAVIAIIPTTLASIAALRASKRNGEALSTIKQQNVELHLSVDGRLDQLLKATSVIGEAKGKSDEQDEQAARDATARGE